VTDPVLVVGRGQSSEKSQQEVAYFRSPLSELDGVRGGVKPEEQTERSKICGGKVEGALLVRTIFHTCLSRLYWLQIAMCGIDLLQIIGACVGGEAGVREEFTMAVFPCLCSLTWHAHKAL